MCTSTVHRDQIWCLAVLNPLYHGYFFKISLLSFPLNCCGFFRQLNVTLALSAITLEPIAI